MGSSSLVITQLIMDIHIVDFFFLMDLLCDFFFFFMVEKLETSQMKISNSKSETQTVHPYLFCSLLSCLS